MFPSSLRKSGLALLPATMLLAISTTPALAGDADSAQCDVTFDAIWSQATHPVDWPGSNAHWSPLIGATHNDQVMFWQPGGLATPGIQSMAEFGATGTLTSEIQTEIGLGTADQVVTGGSIFPSPGVAATGSFMVNRSHPLLTLTSMIAPSPDWFVGLHGLSLFENGSWHSELVVDLPPYDAGTDSGTTFNSGDAATIPAVPISRLTTAPLEGGPSMGTFTIRCSSDLVFLDGFESGNVDGWSSAVGQEP